MEIDHCVFPDDLLYDLENNTWLRVEEDGEVTIGGTSVLPAIAGKLTLARLKAVGIDIHRGQCLGILESLKFVGPIPSPVSVTLLKTNGLVVDKPRFINKGQFNAGWITGFRPPQ